ncbi:MAG TPA: PrsW family intramembrane metalloprotease [Actinomycetes bacterium]|nr:PrsW family intramembrane metalloprotease [Actinomycetes bacterium]
MVTRGLRPMRGSGVWLGLLTVFVLVCMGAAAVLLVGWLTEASGVVGFLAGLSLALVPVAPVLAALMWLDRYEPEPAGLLAFCFAWGATVAAAVAVVFNTVAAQALTAAGTDGLTTTATVIAPVVEEAAKGILLVALLWWRRDEIDGIVDGIVLGATIALGFAFTENVLYFGQAFLLGREGETGQQFFALGLTFVLRGVLGPFAHPLFTACTGLGIGIAAGSRSRSVRVVAPALGYLAAVVLHAMWNVAAIAGLAGFFSAYLLFMVPVFTVAVLVAVLARRRERALIARHLPVYVEAGWLAPGEVATLACLPARRAARALAAQLGGSGAAAAVRDYQRVATELAFLRARAERRGSPAGLRAHEVALLQQLAAARARLPAAPRYPLAG